jgi:cytochrome c553
MKSRALLVALGVAAGAIGGAMAQDGAQLERGRAVVVGAFGTGQVQVGAPQIACMSCHGLDGRGDGSAAFPRLTGQSGWYLYKQLKDYAAGTRPNDIMSPIARELSDAQMEDVAAYYAAQMADSFPPWPADPLTIQRGGALSAVGSASRGIQACVNCHGPAGRGLPPVYPYLAGQYAGYLAAQLRLWQTNVRKNDPLAVMEAIAKRMTPEDIDAVTTYFAHVPPEAPFLAHVPPAAR